MGEKQSDAGDSGKKSGWFKMMIGTVTGLLSGAVMMYATSLVDRVVKPSKPVANFGIDYDTLTVTFHNRSTGGLEGWWDFGDGSPLEPVDPKQELITHTYPGPGEYTAKLSLRNLLGEENERTAPVRLAESTASAAPSVDSIEVVPVSPGSFAPATFRVTCKVKNAQLCVWDVGDSRPMEISTDRGGVQDRLITFNRPGNYAIKVAAVNGSQANDRSQVIRVNAPPAGSIAALLTVTEQATRAERITTAFTFGDAIPATCKDKTYAINRIAPARQGYEIVDVRLPGAKGPGLQGNKTLAVDAATAGPTAKDLHLQLATDRRSVQLTGELVRDGDGSKKGTTLAKVVLPVQLVQERRTSVTRPPVPVTATLAVPGSVTLGFPPLPADWIDAKRQFQLQLRDGDQVIWQDSQLPRGVAVMVHGHRCLLTATQAGEQIRLDLSEARPGTNPTAN